MPLPDAIDHNPRHKWIVRISYPFSKCFPAAFWCFWNGSRNLIFEHTENTRTDRITFGKGITSRPDIHLLKHTLRRRLWHTKWCENFVIRRRGSAVDRKCKGFVPVKLPLQSLQSLVRDTLHSILSRCKTNTKGRQIVLRNPLLHKLRPRFLKCTALCILRCLGNGLFPL